jgi:hypothetical protein
MEVGGLLRAFDSHEVGSEGLKDEWATEDPLPFLNDITLSLYAYGGSRFAYLMVLIARFRV